MTKIIDGNEIKKQKMLEYAKQIKNIPEKLKLVVIQVGNDSASNAYIKNKEKACKEVGILFEHIKYNDATEEKLIRKIEELNDDKNVTGILVQLPLPDTINKDRIINAIAPFKDVDGLTELNRSALLENKKALIPCTALGVMEILKRIEPFLEGKNAVIIGRSKLVGIPLSLLLLKENATVTICHSKTKNIKEIAKNADILIVAIGRKEYIKEDYVKQDAIVIDIGINRDNGKLYGDCDFDNIHNKCKAITPVPGGVGPLTVTYLINNTIEAYNLQQKIEK